MVSDSTFILAGSNEDSRFPLTLIWFIPASEGKYARVCLGYKMIFNSVQGGMNEEGLFVDGNSLGNQGWKSDENKKALLGTLIDQLLAVCANIEDVKEFFNSYNTPALDRARIPVMDKSGASIIVEWYNGEVTFLETEKNYQIATNFVGSKFINSDKPCWRYNKAVEILDTTRSFSLEIVRETLEATSVEGENSKTVYSFICDLKNGDLYVYNYHDYSKALKFNLEEELIKGENQYYLGSLFTYRNKGYENFIRKEGPVKMIELGYNRNKNVALMFFQLLKYEYPKAFNQQICIDILSQVGDNLVKQGKLEDAVVFLERNEQEFPDSAKSHFELANAYTKINNKEKAITQYKKALTINPKHVNARVALENLLNE